MKTATNLDPQLVDSYEEEGYYNRWVSQNEIEHRCNQHDVSLHELPDFTGNWTLFDLLAFLGY